MAWVKLDDKFWADPRVEEVGNEAAGAFARMLSYCGDHLTDGIVSAAKANYIARRKIVDRLAEFGLIVKRGDGWIIPDYLDFNPSRSEVEVMRAQRAEAGRKGGSKRPSK